LRHAVLALFVLLYEVTKCVASALFDPDAADPTRNGIVAIALLLGDIIAVYCIRECDVLRRITS
jgi:ABC-type thiamin/hydroxymethylpyrimidine transport system permease subunit